MTLNGLEKHSSSSNDREMAKVAESGHSSTQRKNVYFDYENKRTNRALVIKQFIVACHKASMNNK